METRILVRVDKLSDEMYTTLREFGKVEVISKLICVYCITTPAENPETTVAIIARIEGVLASRYPYEGTYNVEEDCGGYLSAM